MRLIWKLLRQHISVVQLIGFFLVNLVGVSIILCGVQIYSDVKPVLGGGVLSADDYIVISKQVSTAGMFNRNATRFTSAEIEDLQRQEFVDRVGEFHSSQFRVAAAVQQLSASTMLFFESLPDEFIDAQSRKWHFVEGDTTIPIIIPRAYLNLYNFGFSHSVGLPQFSEELISEIPIKITIGGVGASAEYDAHIVGFSDRINTILVPESFLSWANGKYGRGAKQQRPSRLIVKVNNPSDAAIADYIKRCGYHTEENGSATSKMSYMLKVALVIVVVIGAIFSLLSLVILTLSIYLLLQKNTAKLENLVLVGYAPRAVAAPYKLLAATLNIAVVGVAVVVAVVLRGFYLDKLAVVLGAEVSGSIVPTLVVAAAVAAVVVLFNISIIQRRINLISRKR